MDPTTSQPYPCPNCGSRNVRWRNRRVYDIPLTWLRFFADSVLSTILIRRVTTLRTSRYGGFAEDYRMRRAAYESRVGLTTATRFWRCHDCKQKGQVFTGLDEALSAERADLASMENKIVSDLGGVGSRVDRDGLSDD